MLITYIRSSSYTAWSWCEWKYYLVYVLGMQDPSNKSAEKGNVAHKVLELMARQKLASQNNEETIYEEGYGKFLVYDEWTKLFDFVLEKQLKETSHKYTPKDIQDCKNSVIRVLEYRDGRYDPRKLEIVMPEQYFDIEFTDPWAKYEFKIGGETIKGNLAIRGTMDLIAKDPYGDLEYIDYKTGRRWDWIKSKPKEIKDLEKDPQLLIYYYALRKLYPNRDISMTIFFMNDGGPFSLQYDNDSLKLAKKLIQKRFLDIKYNNNPSWIFGNERCYKFCNFYKNKNESGVSQCEELRTKYQEIGLQKLTTELANRSRWGYNEGGGRSSPKEQ